LGKYMTVVNGNEVTTARGHFNIFPVELSAAPPNYKLTNWSELITAMRAVPGVQVITLNHPTDSHNGFTPFDATHFNRVTGKNSVGLDYGFDAMEIINSGAMRSDWFEPFRCWFALLNRGFKVTGVAGSDSHDVSQFIVGQGRTYIEVADAIPGAIDIHAACESLRAGRVVASLGLFSRIEVNAKAGPGDLITVAGESIKIRGRVECADWMHPERVDLYANGIKVKEFTLGKGRKNRSGSRAYEVNYEMRKPAHDFSLVMIASGKGMSAPYWAVARPYQPSDLHFEQPVLGATNPVWIDADGDGKYSSPRAYAEQLLTNERSDESAVRKLEEFDWAARTQAAEIFAERGVDLLRLGEKSSAGVKGAFKDYLESVKN